MIRRVLILATAAVALIAAPVAAQTDYDGTSGTATVTEDSIGVQGEGFEPNATVNYEVDYQAEGEGEGAAASLEDSGFQFAKAPAAPLEIVETGTTQADASGNVSFAVENRGPGTYTITMTDGVNTAVVGVTVEGDGTGSVTDSGTASGGLPNTGADSSIGMVQIGVVLVAFGAVAVYFARRRRSQIFTD